MPWSDGCEATTMPTMGQHGTGTGPFPITTRQGLTRYRVAVTMADGRRVWRTRPTKRLAELAKAQLIEARDLDLDPTRQTLAVYLRSWLEGLRNARNQRVRPRTLDHYTLIVERHIIPGLDPKGTVAIGRLTSRRIQEWLDRDDGAPRTVQHHRAVLRRALNVAVRQRLLPYNPALAVELPVPSRHVARPLTDDEARRLLAATADDRFGLLWRLAIMTGLRHGELLGLAWEDVNVGEPPRSVDSLLPNGDHRGDGAGMAAGARREVGGERHRRAAVRDIVDLQPASITVRAQLQRLKPERGGDANGWARTPTKAARGSAVVAIDAETAAFLEQHRIRQAAERRSEDLYFGLVFQTPMGRPYH